MKNHLIAISSKIFSTNLVKKEMFAEISSMGCSVTQQIYNDACDVGFSMKSAKTGNEITWYLERENFNADNELESLTYKPLNSDIKKFPSITGWKITLLND